jgi:radical SAM superfamily enzyme YgiQ (UPF0313 family)
VSQILVEQLQLEPEQIARLEAARRSVPDFLGGVVEEVGNHGYEIVVTCADLAVGEDRSQNCATLAFLRRLKAWDSRIATVMGGANCQGELGAAIHDLFPFVDYVCAGEGERVLPRFVQRLLGGQTEIDRPGILGRDLPRLPGLTLSPPLVLDLDGLPYPDFDDFFAQLRAANLGPGPRPILTFETSRGCWWGEKHHCTFCGLNGAGMQYRSKSPQRALEELDFLVDRHGVRTIFASDMILNPAYFDTFLTSLAGRRLPPSIFFET